MTKIISALALLAVLAAATSSCSSNKAKSAAESDTSASIEEFAPVATDSASYDSTSLGQDLSIDADWMSVVL